MSDPRVPITGVILAAGRSTRMSPLRLGVPKALLPIGNRPLIEHHLDRFRALGIHRVDIVVSPDRPEIPDQVCDSPGLDLRFVEQVEPLGIGDALAQVGSQAQGPVLVVLGDVYFVPRDFRRMVDSFRDEPKGAVLAVSDDATPEGLRSNYSIECDDSGRATRVVEKPRTAGAVERGVGIYLFDPAIFDALGRTPKSALRGELELTDAIQTLIDDGLPVRTCACIDEDVNLTFPRDLWRSNLIEARVAGQGTGEGCLIADRDRHHPGAKILRSVVGKNVRITHPIEVSESVVLDGSILDGDTRVSRALITPNQRLGPEDGPSWQGEAE